MNSFTSDPIEFLVASTQMNKSNLDMESYAYALISDSPEDATELIEQALSRFPDMQVIETRQLADSCEDVEVVFEAKLPRDSNADGERKQALCNLASRCNTVFWHHSCVSAPDSELQSQRRGKKLRMRTEFLCDALELRIALLPYVLHWTERSTEFGHETQHPTAVAALDREIELEVVETAPSLDHLRWYINQMVDMHVAAESLQDANRYTGERLPYHLLVLMEPPLAVVECLLDAAKAGANWFRRSDCRLRELVNTLTKHKERLQQAG